MLLAFRVPAGNERGPLHLEQALAAIHHANPERLTLTLEIAARDGEVELRCRVPDTLRATVTRQLYAHYPEGTCELLAEESPTAAGTHTDRLSLQLQPDLFPLKRHGQFAELQSRTTADPLAGVLEALSGTPKESLHATVRIAVTPALTRQVEARWACLGHPRLRDSPRLAWWYLRFADGAGWTALPGRLLAALWVRRTGTRPEMALTSTSSQSHEREADLHAAADKLSRPLFLTRMLITVSGPSAARQRIRAKAVEVAGAFGAFDHRSARLHSRRHAPRPFALSSEELASLWHPVTLSVRSPGLRPVDFRELPPPADLPGPRQHRDLPLLGVTSFRGNYRKFGLLPEDRFRHLALLGKTGVGKSTVLQRLVLADMAAGRGLCLVDPHGDLCEAVLAGVPRQRTNDVVLLDPADATHPLAFNLLSCREPSQRPLVASGVLSVFKKIYGEFWGPRMEHILRNCLLALLEAPGSTLVSILRLLSDVRYRRDVLQHVSDPVVRLFWEREFAAMPARLQAEATAPIQNKVGAFVSSPLLRNVLGQAHSKLDLRTVMDADKILLVNLSKGRLGDDASALLGSLLVTAVQLAAMSRADVPEGERSDFFLYVDEFQNYATESFATILSEARKYRLALTVANQYLGQLPEATLHALFGNAQSLICFQVGATDAEILATQLGGGLEQEDLLRLPRYHAYARLLIAGEPSLPFSMKTLAVRPRYAAEHRAAIVRRTSQHRYSRPQEAVEREIAQAIGG